MPHFKVKASYLYDSQHEDDLSFPEGQIITVTEEEGDDWYVGEYTDEGGRKHEGLFPRNFVERYEPALPARPNRASKHKPLEELAAQPAQPAPPTPTIPQQDPEPEPEPEPVQQQQQQQQDPPRAQPPPLPQAVEVARTATPVRSPVQSPVLSPKSPASGRSGKAAPDVPPASPAPRAPAAEPAKKAPPPVAKKNNAFLDRINAFNKGGGAPPPQPLKVGGGAPSTFIKKPFVAPPPRADAFVPPPREAPQVRTYRREEDPEVAERQAQDQENAERAGLAANATSPTNGADAEEPAPTLSLKERIAALQKQQQEQATRAAALLKEKPKKPPPPPAKKRTESFGAKAEEGDDARLEKSITSDSKERGSIDSARPPRSAHGVKPPEGGDLLSDANDADQSGAGDTENTEDTSTSLEDDEKHKATRAPAAPTKEPDVGDEQDAEEEDEDEDEESAEIRRKAALRDRMARIGGGFGMPGMFGAPPPPLPKKKLAEKKASGDAEEHYLPQQRVPMFGIPSMVKSPENENKQLAVEKEDDASTPGPSADAAPEPEDLTQETLQKTPTVEHPPPADKNSVPAPPERGVPPPVPSASRPIRSPSPGSESGDELTDAQGPQSVASPKTPSAIAPSKRNSILASNEMSGDSLDKRAMPPIPLASPGAPRARVPPPLPPAPPSRRGTLENSPKKVDREGETDYEGDYDTDIAPGATHKDALKSHAREPSLDDSTAADEGSVRSPTTPSAPPPLPPIAPKAVPPPPPSQPPKRLSLDAPRGAPPPPPGPPPARDIQDGDDDYDPYNYAAPPGPPKSVPPPPRNVPPPPTSVPPPLQTQFPPPEVRPTTPAMPSIPPPVPQQQATESSDDDLYRVPTPPAQPRKSHDRPPPPPPLAPPPTQRLPPLPQDRVPPPPPSLDRPAPPPPPDETSPQYRAARNKSLEVNRALRTSQDLPRPSASREFMASDLDLGTATVWWSQPNTLPPSVQRRSDVLTDLNESKSEDMVEKLIHVLYIDYSQTIISARFDANDVTNVELEQHQEPPPMRLRQDQLESAHDQFGVRIAKDAESKQNMTIGDGSAISFINALLSPYNDALKPVSTRSFGALVYANMANASSQQYDEIRPGDIISFRNCQFKGTHGRMHTKYSVEAGKPAHVGVVIEWDGSKKKVRIWEQGREKKKVKEESFKLSDMRSGEVRVWRVMGRHWVGWN